MEEVNMKDTVQDENRNIKFDQGKNNQYNKIEKIANAPEWNEDLQKIVVGYH
ncbi:MAG TPA: hypothetical protein VFC27_04175 [Anaerovoracaceae bacterium]|nr:hypothetical protein [Anaerovoracaceae bacterium]